MNKKLLALMMALVCALGVMGLSACGDNGSSGGSAADASSSAAAEPAGPSDEELIKQDVDNFFDDVLSKETLAGVLRANEDVASLESMGMDIDRFAQTMADAIKVEVDSVAVDGDTAVATVKMTTPDFTEAMEQKLQDDLNAAIEGKDPSSMTEDELMGVLNDVVNNVMTDPDTPTTSETVDIEYVKEDGTWAMKDKDAADQIKSAMTEAISG